MTIPLHCKSHYSFGYGTASPEALVMRAAALDHSALALTDIENLAGQLQFHDCCREHGIRPITGVELRPDFDRRRVGSRTGRLLLLARSRTGYRSLCRIVSRRRGAAGARAARAGADPVDALAGLAEDVVALTDDPATLARLCALDDLQADDVGLLLVRPAVAAGAEATALRAARRLRVAVVADPEAVFLDPADHALHVLQLAIRQGRRTAEADVLPGVEPAQRWLRPPQDAARLYTDIPEAVDGAAAVSERCRLELAPAGKVLPGAGAFADTAPVERLTSICHAALETAREQGRCQDARYDERLAEELAMIAQTGYAGYFLVAAEIAAAARARGIPVAARGSAVGSLVVHLAGVSNIDPMAHDLLFERFLHAGRSEPPDIDMEACAERRDELIEWTRRRFGRGHVAVVGAHHGFKLRGALREGLKAVGVSPNRIERTCASLPPDGEPAPALNTLGIHLNPGQRDALPLILRLVGKPRHLALHPAGLVVSDARLDDVVPLEAAPRGLIVTQHDMRAAARAGLVKLDLLGSKLLTQLAAAARLAGQDENAGVLDRPLDDPATLTRLDRADTIGCFQVETPAVRALLARLAIGRIEDLVAALALVRPGAAGGAAKQEYVRRVRGAAPARPIHPALAARLRQTQGLLLYDEDLIHVLADVGGLSLGAADELRSAIIAAGDDAGALRALRRHFLDRAHAAGAEAALAEAVWRTARRFAAYSFSRAQAWSYAVMAYAAVYMKTHHPVAWGCALLGGYGGAYPMRTIAADLERSGIRLLPPAVNDPRLAAGPGRGWDTIRLGLGQVKHLSRKSAQAVVASRRERGRFRSMDDLLGRVRLPVREARALILVGACDDLAPLSPDVYPFAHEALVKGLDGELDPINFKRAIQSARVAPPDDERRRRYRLLMRIRNELDILGMHPSAHPMRVLRADARRQGCLTAEALRQGRAHEDNVRFAGVVAASRRHPLGAGRTMQFLTLEDETGLVEAVIPAPAYPRLAERVTTPGPYLVDGVMENDAGHPYLTIADLRPFHERGRPS